MSSRWPKRTGRQRVTPAGRPLPRGAKLVRVAQRRRGRLGLRLLTNAAGRAKTVPAGGEVHEPRRADAAHPGRRHRGLPLGDPAPPRLVYAGPAPRTRQSHRPGAIPQRRLLPRYLGPPGYPHDSQPPGTLPRRGPEAEGQRMNWAERARAIQVGDTIAYSAAFLRSIGTYTGVMPRARGTVTALVPVGSHVTLAEI